MADILKFPDVKDFDMVELSRVSDLCGPSTICVFTTKLEELERVIELRPDSNWLSYTYISFWKCGNEIGGRRCFFHYADVENLFIESLKDIPSFPEQELQKLIKAKQEDEKIQKEINAIEVEAVKRWRDYIEEAKEYLISIEATFENEDATEKIKETAVYLAKRKVPIELQEKEWEKHRAFARQARLCSKIILERYRESFKES